MGFDSLHPFHPVPPVLFRFSLPVLLFLPLYDFPPCLKILVSSTRFVMSCFAVVTCVRISYFVLFSTIFFSLKVLVGFTCCVISCFAIGTHVFRYIVPRHSSHSRHFLPFYFLVRSFVSFIRFVISYFAVVTRVCIPRFNIWFLASLFVRLIPPSVLSLRCSFTRSVMSCFPPP